MTMPTIPDVALPEAIEAAAGVVVRDWLAHLGYTPGEIAVTDEPRRHTADCRLTEDGWECVDEDLVEQHPAHTAADEAAYLVMFTLEHPSVTALLHTRVEPVDTEGAS